jgi:hypothetical protein
MVYLGLIKREYDNALHVQTFAGSGPNAALAVIQNQSKG